ncbi:MAG: hypothetical protein AMXMBFR34_17800 [Myxococcaceae bacterium]
MVAPPQPPPKRWRVSPRETSVAALVERLAREGRQVPAPVAVRLVADALRGAEGTFFTAPSHLFLDDGGRVRLASPDKPVVQLGAAWRTWAAPEVVLGQPLTASALQFSLGAVLAELLAGAPLYSATTRDELLASLRRPVPLPPLGPFVPRELAPVLTRMLQADAGARYATHADCADALAACFSHAKGAFERAAATRAALARESALASRPPQAPPPSARWPFLLAFVGVACAGAGLAWYQAATAPKAPATFTQPGAPGEEAPDAPRQPTYLLSSTPPGAALWVDGQHLGFAPGRLALPLGRRYEVRLTLPCHHPETLRLSPDEDAVDAPLTVTLLRTSAPLAVAAVRSVPDDSLVLLDAQPVARTPAEVPLEANRRHTLQVVFPDGGAWKQDLQLQEHQHRTWEARSP